MEGVRERIPSRLLANCGARWRAPSHWSCYRNLSQNQDGVFDGPHYSGAPASLVSAWSSGHVALPHEEVNTKSRYSVNK